MLAADFEAPKTHQGTLLATSIQTQSRKGWTAFASVAGLHAFCIQLQPPNQVAATHGRLFLSRVRACGHKHRFKHRNPVSRCQRAEEELQNIKKANVPESDNFGCPGPCLLIKRCCDASIEMLQLFHTSEIRSLQSTQPKSQLQPAKAWNKYGSYRVLLIHCLQRQTHQYPASCGKLPGDAQAPPLHLCEPSHAHRENKTS